MKKISQQEFGFLLEKQKTSEADDGHYGIKNVNLSNLVFSTKLILQDLIFASKFAPDPADSTTIVVFAG
jgi:hypothetical protein